MSLMLSKENIEKAYEIADEVIRSAKEKVVQHWPEPEDPYYVDSEFAVIKRKIVATLLNYAADVEEENEEKVKARPVSFVSPKN